MLRRTLVLALLTIPATAHATAPMNPGGWGQLGDGARRTRADRRGRGSGHAQQYQLLVAGGTDAFTFYGHGEGYGELSSISRDAATGALAPLQCVSSDGSDGAGNEGCSMRRSR